MNRPSRLVEPDNQRDGNTTSADFINDMMAAPMPPPIGARVTNTYTYPRKAERNWAGNYELLTVALDYGSSRSVAFQVPPSAVDLAGGAPWH